jgi:ankyrin repeat protein
VKAKLTLHEAVEAGDVELTEALLTQDPYLTSVRNGFGEAALHRAAAMGRADLTRTLLAHAAAVEPVSHIGRTPLHLAAEAGHVDAAKVLLDHKAKPSPMNGDGETPLHLAARNGHVGMVRLLLARRADPNAMGEYTGSPLHEAAANGRYEAAEALLARGALANAQSKGSATAWSPWHEARKAGHGELAELLRQHGGEDRAKGPIDLQRAAEAGYIGRIQTLLDTDPSLLDSRDFLHRRTALHWAADRGDLALAKLLLGLGADRTRVDKQGKTALDLALARNHSEMAALLGPPA